MAADSPEAGETLRVNPGSVGDRMPELSASAVKTILREIVLERATGGVEMPTKQSIYFGGGHFFQAMIASSKAKGVAICKWIGLAPDPSGANQQSHATILVSDIAAGRLLDVVGADVITLARTAALSLLAFELSNKPAPGAVGFIGAGRQATAHLHAFADAYPKLGLARVYAPRPAPRHSWPPVPPVPPVPPAGSNAKSRVNRNKFCPLAGS